VRKLRDELLDRVLRIQPDLNRIRADEGPTEDPARQPADVVPFERLENADRDLGAGGDLTKRDAAALARGAKPAAIFAGAFCSHRAGGGVALC